MYCPHCGLQQSIQSARYCHQCGLKLDGVKRVLESDTISAGRTLPASSTHPDSISFSVPTPIEEIERGMILSTLTKTGGNKTRTAELLKISLKTLHNKLSLYRSHES